jgi:hypothetical protein
VTSLYATGVPLLQMGQAAVHRPNPQMGAAAVRLALGGLRLNFEDLPPAEVLARHLSGVVTYTCVEDDCIRIGFVSQLGAPLLVVPAAMLAGAAAVAFQRGQVVARERILVVQAEHARAMLEAQRAAQAVQQQAGAAERAADVEKLRAENAMLRERLAKLEEQVAALLRAVEEEK